MDRRMEDTRLVQAAVLDHPDSDAPVVMPVDREDARRFRDRHGARGFWCGTLLGGCGTELSTKIYGDRVCHFAHYPSVESCRREARGHDSADHLFAGRGLRSWLAGQRRSAHVQYEEPSRTGAAGTRVTVHPGSNAPAIHVEFASRYDAQLAELVERTRQRKETWLVHDNERLSSALLERDGHSFGIELRELPGTRVVYIKTRTRDLRTLRNELSECTMTAGGLMTPALRARRRSGAGPRLDGSVEHLLAFCAQVRAGGDTAQVQEAVRMLAAELPRVQSGAARESCRTELLEMQRLLAAATDLDGLLSGAEASRRREDAGTTAAIAANAERLIVAHPESAPLREATRIRELGRWAQNVLANRPPSVPPEQAVPRPRNATSQPESRGTPQSARRNRAAPRRRPKPKPPAEHGPPVTEVPAIGAAGNEALQRLANRVNEKRSR